MEVEANFNKLDSKLGSMQIKISVSERFSSNSYLSFDEKRSSQAPDPFHSSIYACTLTDWHWIIRLEEINLLKQIIT